MRNSDLGNWEDIIRLTITPLASIYTFPYFQFTPSTQQTSRVHLQVVVTLTAGRFGQFDTSTPFTHALSYTVDPTRILSLQLDNVKIFSSLTKSHFPKISKISIWNLKQFVASGRPCGNIKNKLKQTNVKRYFMRKLKQMKIFLTSNDSFLYKNISNFMEHILYTKHNHFKFIYLQKWNQLLSNVRSNIYIFSHVRIEQMIYPDHFLQ